MPTIMLILVVTVTGFMIAVMCEQKQASEQSQNTHRQQFKKGGYRAPNPYLEGRGT